MAGDGMLHPASRRGKKGAGNSTSCQASSTAAGSNSSSPRGPRPPPATPTPTAPTPAAPPQAGFPSPMQPPPPSIWPRSGGSTGEGHAPQENMCNILDDFITEDNILDEVLDQTMGFLKTSLEALQKEADDHRLHPRKYIKRPREEFGQRLFDDYFSEDPVYPSNIFCRSAADHLDDYLKIGETTAMEAMKNFVEGVIAVFGERYLRRPTVEDTERLLKIGEKRGFPGMFGSIDCMHWHWERCPTAWKGQFTRGDQKVPTIILEAVASHDLWIWHAFFGVAGSNNGINVLNQSTVFIEDLKGQAPRVQYMVNGNQHNIGYYLADGIYTDWAVFVKSIRMPISEKDKLYAQEQEGARKDIERAFGVLQRRFCILKQPARLYDRNQLRNVVLACIIIHNMIVEDEKEDELEENLDLNEDPSTMIVEEPEFSPDQYVTFERVLEKDSEIQDRPARYRLKKDLVEHIWNKFGRRRNHEAAA